MTSILGTALDSTGFYDTHYLCSTFDIGIEYSFAVLWSKEVSELFVYSHSAPFGFSLVRAVYAFFNEKDRIEFRGSLIKILLREDDALSNDQSQIVFSSGDATHLKRATEIVLDWFVYGNIFYTYDLWPF